MDGSASIIEFMPARQVQENEKLELTVCPVECVNKSCKGHVRQSHCSGKECITATQLR